MNFILKSPSGDLIVDDESFIKDVTFEHIASDNIIRISFIDINDGNDTPVNISCVYYHDKSSIKLIGINSSNNVNFRLKLTLSILLGLDIKINGVIGNRKVSTSINDINNFIGVFKKILINIIRG